MRKDVLIKCIFDLLKEKLFLVILRDSVFEEMQFLAARYAIEISEKKWALWEYKREYVMKKDKGKEKKDTRTRWYRARGGGEGERERWGR